MAGMFIERQYFSQKGGIALYNLGALLQPLPGRKKAGNVPGNFAYSSYLVAKWRQICLKSLVHDLQLM